jgi:1,4-dihydroxy-2-naphthoyl-CoA hydrolase
MTKSKGKAKFIHFDKVRMHDTDMAGILYFPRQFRFINDTFEDLMELEGLNFQHLFNVNDYAFVIRHVEADYLHPLHVGNKLEVHLNVDHIGNTSFILSFDIYNLDEKSCLTGTVKVVQVCVDSKTREKIPVPKELKKILKKYVR